MILARVLGNVVASEKHAAFFAHKLMIVQPLDELLKDNGKSFLAIDDKSCSGKGDLVLVLREGTGVRQIVGDKMAPIRSCIVGVVDQVQTQKP